MDKESIAGAIIMALCCGGCAITFNVIALCARKSQKPFGFWSGIKVDPAKVPDILAYNRANSRMWDLYSIPFWLAAVLSCFGDGFLTASAILLSLACFPGMFFLVFRYRKIEKQYMTK